jgi:transposase InsO family protein
MLFEVLGLPKSTYYDNKGKDYTAKKHHKYSELIIKSFEQSGENYGYRRISGTLRDEGTRISPNTVRKIMNQEQLVVKKKKMRKYNSYDKSKDTSYAPNLLNRDFNAEKPFEKLATDVTEFKIRSGKIYLSPLYDLKDKLVLGASVESNALTSSVLNMFEGCKNLIANAITHSDRGCQYHSGEYTNYLYSSNITQSMSKKGCSSDNSAMEGFFGVFKNDYFYNRDFSDYSPEDFKK